MINESAREFKSAGGSFGRPPGVRHALELIGIAAVCDRVIRFMAFVANPGTARRITATIKRMK
jgi:hypothetical protein